MTQSSGNWYCNNEKCPLGKTRKCGKYKCFAPAGVTDFRCCQFKMQGDKVICQYKKPV